MDRELWEKITEAKEYVTERTTIVPLVSFILGSGFGSIIKDMEIDVEIPFGDIPHFSDKTVEHHKAVLVFGKLSGKPVMVFAGRYHPYEGHAPETVCMPVWLTKALGVTMLFITNSAGGLNHRLYPSDIMLLTDHINLTGLNPLVGENNYKIGPRFPSMHQAYAKRLRTHIHQSALRCNVSLKEGIYAGVLGPSLETPAEYRYLQNAGADAVGMSTVLETIAAIHCGLEVAAFSAITDSVTASSGGALKPTSVMKAAKKAEIEWNKLIKKVMEKLCVKPISNQ